MTQDRIYNYFERNPKLRVLFIFDSLDIIAAELRDSEWQEGFHYQVFDGTWFGTKYKLENDWKNEKVVLLFKEEDRPKDEASRLKFPLLDLLEANMEYKEDDYASFIQQYHLPEKLTPFIKRNMTLLQSNRIMQLLQNYLTPEAFGEDVFYRAVISDLLGQKKVLEWEDIVIRLIIMDANHDQKKGQDFFARIYRHQEIDKALQAKLTALFGCGYLPNDEDKMRDIAESIKYNSFTQLLETSANDLYKKYKITSRLTVEQMNRVLDRAMSDRTLAGPFNEALAKLGAEVAEDEIIRVYGIDANYFYVTEALCWPIIATAAKERLQAEPQDVIEKMRDLSLKLPERQTFRQSSPLCRTWLCTMTRFVALGR